MILSIPLNTVSFADIIFSLGPWRVKFVKLLDFTLGGLAARVLKGKKEEAEPPGQPDSILIIRPGGIGDAVFLLPILRKIKDTLPSLKVDILCEKRNVQIFSSQAGLYHRLFCYDIFKEFRALRRNHYDIILDTEQWHYLSAITAYFLKGKYCVGFATRPWRAKLFDRKIEYQINAYELENFKALFKFLLGDLSGLQDINLCYTLSEVNRRRIAEIPTPFVSLFIGASITPRRLTEEQCLAIIRFTFEKGYSIALLGGRDVLKAGQEIEREMDTFRRASNLVFEPVEKLNWAGDKRLFNFVGRTSLEETAALISQSKLFVGADSGLMHLACAVGTPVVGIFGPGNAAKWHPKGKDHSVVTENIECSPCTRFGYTVPTCHGSYHCMRAIHLEKIINKISEYLQ